MRKVARKTDTSDHGGSIVFTNTDETVTVEGHPVAVDGAQLQCGNSLHGLVTITNNLSSIFTVNSKYVVLENSVASCGAKIIVNQNTVFSE